MINRIQAVLDASHKQNSGSSVTTPQWNFWSKSSIAALSAMQVARMNVESLEKVIELVRDELPPSMSQLRLQLCDRTTLERLTYLARCICRNQGY